MSSKKSNALPPLAFGQESAVVHQDAKQFGDLIDSVFPGLNAYDPQTDAASFRSQTVVIPLATSKIVATALSPTTVDRSGNSTLTFLLPYAGDPEASNQIGEEKLRWGLGKGGLYLPATDQRLLGTGGFRSQIMWQLEQARLQETANKMFAHDKGVDLHLDRSRLLPLEIAGVRTDASWQAILPMLQLHRTNPNLLVQLGIEDLLYRHSVMLLRPDLFQRLDGANSDARDEQRLRRLLDPLCEYILQHLADPLTLTDLESISGLSARSLQLAFKSRYRMSPLGWIKEMRLTKVRSELQAHPGTPVELIALSAGFQTMPAFFKAYKERFGETPRTSRLKS